MKIVARRLANFFLEAKRFQLFFLDFLSSPFFLFLIFSSFAARWVTSGRFRGGARRRVPRELYDARVRRSGQTSVKSRLSLRLCVTHKGDRARARAPAHFSRVRIESAKLARKGSWVIYLLTLAYTCMQHTRDGEERKRGWTEMSSFALPNAHYPHRRRRAISLRNEQKASEITKPSEREDRGRTWKFTNTRSTRSFV